MKMTTRMITTARMMTKTKMRMENGGDSKENKDDNEQNEDNNDFRSEQKKRSTADEDREWTDRVFGDDPEERDGSYLDDSPARLEWLRQKREENEENEHLDRLSMPIFADPPIIPRILTCS
jgi:hypothetical protein